MKYSPEQAATCDSHSRLSRKRVLTSDGRAGFLPLAAGSPINATGSSDQAIIRHQAAELRDCGVRPIPVKPRSKLRDRLRNKCFQKFSSANLSVLEVPTPAFCEGGASGRGSLFGLEGKSRDQSSDVFRPCNESSPVENSLWHPQASDICQQRTTRSPQSEPPTDIQRSSQVSASQSVDDGSASSKPLRKGNQRPVIPSTTCMAAGGVITVTHSSGAGDDKKNHPSTLNTQTSPGRRKGSELSYVSTEKNKDESRQLWSKEQDSELRRVMRDLGLDSLFTTKTYYPAGDVDWDAVVVEFNNNLPDRFPRFSKKQVKDRWEQHLRPGLLQHKSLTKPIRQRIVKHLEDAVPQETYINRGKPCVRWMNIASRVWEYGLRCSASTIKNVWNSHLHKMKSSGPGINKGAGGPQLESLLETNDDEARTNSIDNRTRQQQQSTSPSPEIHIQQLQQSDFPLMPTSQLVADWQAYHWQRALLDSHAATIQPLSYSQLHTTSSRRGVSTKGNTPFFLSPEEGCARELEPTTPSSASEKDAIYSPKHYATGYQRRCSGSPRRQGRPPPGSPSFVDAAVRESSLLEGWNSAAAISYSLYGMHPAYHAAAAVSTETMYRMYLAATGYVPPAAAAAGHHGYSALDPRGKKREFPSHGLYPGLYPPTVPGSPSSPSDILSSDKSKVSRCSHLRGFLPVDDPYSISTSSFRLAPRGMRDTEHSHRKAGGDGEVPEHLPPYFKRARHS